MSTKNIINQTAEFTEWVENLKDRNIRNRIVLRIRAASLGNFGDTKSVGSGVYEMRVHIGPGYRIYYAREGEVVYVLLSGGTKASQKQDIKNAQKMWLEIKG
jgi:putative addiction module killer protein